MNFFINCLKGIAIGAGAILPGISSGVLCLIFGIYETLLNSILDFFNDIKKNSNDQNKEPPYFPLTHKLRNWDNNQ